MKQASTISSLRTALHARADAGTQWSRENIVSAETTALPGQVSKTLLRASTIGGVAVGFALVVPFSGSDGAAQCLFDPSPPSDNFSDGPETTFVRFDRNNRGQSVQFSSADQGTASYLRPWVYSQGLVYPVDTETDSEHLFEHNDQKLLTLKAALPEQCRPLVEQARSALFERLIAVVRGYPHPSRDEDGTQNVASFCDEWVEQLLTPKNVTNIEKTGRLTRLLELAERYPSMPLLHNYCWIDAAEALSGDYYYTDSLGLLEDAELATDYDSSLMFNRVWRGLITWTFPAPGLHRIETGTAKQLIECGRSLDSKGAFEANFHLFEIHLGFATCDTWKPIEHTPCSSGDVAASGASPEECCDCERRNFQAALACGTPTEIMERAGRAAVEFPEDVFGEVLDRALQLQNWDLGCWALAKLRRSLRDEIDYYSLRSDAYNGAQIARNGGLSSAEKPHPLDAVQELFGWRDTDPVRAGVSGAELCLRAADAERILGCPETDPEGEGCDSSVNGST